MLEIQTDELIIPDYGLVYFYNNYDESCKKVDRILNSIVTSEHNIIKVNTEEYPLMVEYYGIDKVPCLVAVNERKVVEKKFGFLNEEKISKLLKKTLEY